MKICILTQNLHTNFGGLMQAYALQKALKDKGFDVLTDEKSAKLIKKSKITILKDLIRPIYRIITNKPKPNPMPKLIYNDILTTNAVYFRDKYINTTVFLENTGLKSKKNIKDFDAFIVGSDQVWRPRYNPYQNLYFLDFTKAYKVKRIAYAASFGMDSLDEFSEKDLATAKKMLPLFDAVSVREDSGIALCRDNFNVEATHVLDPTLLLDKDDYLKLIEGDDTTNKRTNSLMVYLLDETEEKQEMIAKAETQLNLSAYIISPYKTKESPEEHKYQKPSISAWLAGYRDASFVLTDSFHGVVFSIIFKKNFIAINNEERGSARFDSLLRLFGLEDRLISDISQLNLEKLEEINYTQVNKILNDKKKLSLDLLFNALKK